MIRHHLQGSRARLSPVYSIIAIPYRLSALALLAITLFGQTQTPFIHPGAMNTQESLRQMRSRLKTADLQELERLATAGQQPGSTLNSHSEEQAEIGKQSALSAYANALLWSLKSNPTNSRRGIEILNHWSDFQAFTGGDDQDRLLAGWLGSLLAEAAEILRTAPEWKPSDFFRLQSMFRKVFYPQLKTASRWNGNVDLTQTEALLALAVVDDDQSAFQLGLKRLQNRSAAYFFLKRYDITPIEGDGQDVNAFWSHPLAWPDGLTQETCRDNGHHAQFGLASALHAAEIAWNQGEDIYGREAERYTAAMELLARQLRSGSMLGVCQQASASTKIYDTFAVGYRHYHGRKGMSLPGTAKLLTELAKKGAASDWNIFHESWTHGNPFFGISPTTPSRQDSQ